MSSLIDTIMFIKFTIIIIIIIITSMLIINTLTSLGIGLLSRAMTLPHCRKPMHLPEQFYFSLVRDVQVEFFTNATEKHGNFAQKNV